MCEEKRLARQGQRREEIQVDVQLKEGQIPHSDLILTLSILHLFFGILVCSC